jgi:cysteine desulfurase/selenocysteine lyase
MPMIAASPIQVELARRHFYFPESHQVVTNNAASTQPPRELIDLFRALSTTKTPIAVNQRRPRRAVAELASERRCEAMGRPPV